MEKGKTRLRWVGTFVAVAVVLFCGVRAQGDEEAPVKAGKARADVIAIDTLKVFGDLEKPEVLFFHDRHTDALEKMDKDCSVCHLSESTSGKIPGTFDEAVKGIDRLSPKFKRLKDTARQEVMDVYHKFCIECHTDMAKTDQKTGPVDCGGCHKGETAVSSRQPMGFDKSLHHIHSEAEQKNCDRCHHVYDEKEKKLVSAKGQEGSCRHCHKEEREENRISMRLASHLSCIDCHREKNVGPVKCSGCHDPELQKAIEKVSPVPRMERNQPDQLLVSTGITEEDDGQLRMCPVPFDHKAHEEYNDNCRVCHHASMDPCSECHTVSGSKEGKGINLERAMHLAKSEKSCVGCHNEKKTDAKCAGCHAFMEKGRMAESSCEKCHMKPEGQQKQGWSKRLAGSEDTQAVAEKLLKSRKAVTATYGDADIPENVVIKDLAKQYDPVEFPHRKIVKALMKDISDDKLAMYFHSEAGTLCQGCHHNTPVAKNPPRCANCHGAPFDETKPFVPGLLGAYHQQCIGCHENMGMKDPTNCTDCHKDFKEKHKDYKEKM